jgi:hypothetical protein
MGISVSRLNTPFLCPLHADERPSAALCRGDNDQIVFHDYHAQGSKYEFLTLPDLRASIAYKRSTKLKETSYTQFHLLMLYEASEITPAPVQLPPAPDGAPEYVVAVRDAFELHLGLHWLLERGKPLAFSARRAAALSGQSRAHRAIQALVDAHVMRLAGTWPSGHENPTHLYLPGDGRS